MIAPKNIFTYLLAFTTVVFAGHPKIAKDLDQMTSDASVDVIIQFQHAPTEAQHGNVRRHGGKQNTVLHLIKGAAYSVPADQLADLANDPEVSYISPDREVRGLLDKAAPTIGGDFAHANGWDGQGIGVAVIDSGISEVQDLKGRVVYKESFIASKNDSHDFYGHGTHVSGILAGDGKSSKGKYIGIASKALLLNLRVLDENGHGRDSAVIAAIQRAIQLKNTYNVRVINLSIGRAINESFSTDPLCQAVEAAWKAGIVVVVAAGNELRASGPRLAPARIVFSFATRFYMTGRLGPRSSLRLTGASAAICASNSACETGSSPLLSIIVRFP